jgi:hypothetical protein
MNMAVHGLTGVIKSGDEANTFYHDAHNLNGCCDYVMANPPFNVDKVKSESAQSAGRLPFGLTLPVTLVTERTVRYAAGEAERSPEEARAEGEAQLMAQLRTALAQRDGSLLHHRFDAVRQGTQLVVTLHAECEEQIGVSSPLDIQDMGR